MAVGTDTGLFELDVIRTRTVRQTFLNSGASVDSIEDPDTWRSQDEDDERFTVHPRDIVDDYYTAPEYSGISGCGVTPWDQVSVNTRAKPHDWELDRVWSSCVPLSARDTDTNGYNHNNVLVRRVHLSQCRCLSLGLRLSPGLVPLSFAGNSCGLSSVTVVLRQWRCEWQRVAVEEQRKQRGGTVSSG